MSSEAELRAAAEFFGTQSNTNVREGVITGALAPLRGFVEALSEASGLDLHCGSVNVSGAEALGSIDRSVAPVAVGLAIGALQR